MTCLKTGAYVHFLEYNAYAPADLYECAGAIVVRIPLAWDECVSYAPERVVTHAVIGDQASFWRKDLGVFVVPACQLTEVGP